MSESYIGGYIDDSKVKFFQGLFIYYSNDAPVYGFKHVIEKNETTNKYYLYSLGISSGLGWQNHGGSSRSSITGITDSMFNELDNMSVFYSALLKHANSIYAIRTCNKVEYIEIANVRDYILSNVLEYNNVPVYKDSTKISYTDGSYEVVDSVLSEQQAKEKAYKSLLDSYGSFYRASEKDISGSYSHINWGGGN